MKFSDVVLPSNKKFGFFFALLFLIFSLNFYIHNYFTTAYFLLTSSVIFIIITLVSADLLMPLNKLWMRFGFILGLFISPVVLAVIFFGFFTPIAIIARSCGRDELRLHFKKKNTHWIFRDDEHQSSSFNYQF